MPLIRGERWVLVGDHQQLPPYADDALQARLVREGLDPQTVTRSLFEELQGPFERRGCYVFLDRQGRMHPDISAFVSARFYGGRLHDFPHAATHTLAGPTFLPDSPNLLLLDTRQLPDRQETKRGTGYVNLLEQELSVFILRRMVMAVAPEPLDVVLYEAPVLARSQPPQNPLRGFIQEAVSLLEQPTAAETAALLHLPTTVVELVLGNLQQVGGVASDTAGRWSVPQAAPQFGKGGNEPLIWRRTRRLLCYWPKRDVLLPVLPRMRLRDLVELGVHKLQGEVADWYARIASWSDPESSKRGRAEAMRILPLGDTRVQPGSDSAASSASPDAPVPEEDVLVSRCRLDVVALTWSSFRSGVWEVVSRLWSRPTSVEDGEGVPFAPGEPLLGLSLPEQLLGGGSPLNALGSLFNPEAWRTLLDEQQGLPGLRRELDENVPALIVGNQTDAAERGRWRGLFTPLAREARLLCYMTSPTAKSAKVRR